MWVAGVRICGEGCCVVSVGSAAVPDSQAQGAPAMWLRLRGLLRKWDMRVGGGSGMRRLRVQMVVLFDRMDWMRSALFGQLQWKQGAVFLQINHSLGLQLCVLCG
ncbi:MAG: hypothetical protein GQ533_03960 [Methanosarcinaceae archaeon]|nr:hypothetical protein [Methanosarcinaceae archaeon]